MTRIEKRNLFCYCALAAGLALGVIPLFFGITLLTPIEIAAGAPLIVTALFGLRHPRRVRLPRKRTFS